jgi:hypothetical protein
VHEKTIKKKQAHPRSKGNLAAAADNIFSDNNNRFSLFYLKKKTKSKARTNFLQSDCANVPKRIELF